MRFLRSLSLPTWVKMNKAMGLDLGARTCGVALSDIMGMIASPLETIRFEEDDYETARDRIVDIIKANNVKKVVLGLPKHMNGDVGVRGEISIQFKEMLLEKADVEVILWDERLTTVAADKAMIEAGLRREERKEHVDKVAAVFILQGYLDYRAMQKKTVEE